MQEADIIREFLIESNENLTRLDQEMVDLERRPDDAELLASIFRTVHTIKGACGFLCFGTLETIAHQAENILGQLRCGQRALDHELTSVLLEAIDAIKHELASIESTGAESGESYACLLDRLKQTATCPAPGTPVEPTDPASSAGRNTGEDAPVPPEAESRLYARRRTDTAFSAADSTIRVDVALLNKLMNLVGELVLTRNQILQFSVREETLGLNATAQKLNLITTELQEGIMRTRMQPIGNVWASLPRVVRDLAALCKKQIVLDMTGAETELDKTIIEAIKDPLTHIVRNACDHGIETPERRARCGKPIQGMLSLSAFHEGGNVIIEIADDGAGIDPQTIKAAAVTKGLISPERAERMSDREVINLVFLPGFSTARELSSISGRGVGMDVVRTNIEKIGGTVDIVSRPEKGTTIRIKIPLTLAIIPGLVVTSGEERFVIPQISLVELLRLEADKARSQIEHINGAPVYRRRGSLLPLADLNAVLQVDPIRKRTEDAVNIVVLQAEERKFGLIVDAINDTQEIVVKPLGGLLKSIKGYAGATIMGDGKVALILDVPGIAQVSGIMADVGGQHSGIEAESPVDQAACQTLLLFSAGSFQRLGVPLSLVARLEEFPASALERAAGGLVVQYRGQILPLVHLAAHLDGGSPALIADPFTTIVFADGERRVGLIVDSIIDIVEDRIQARTAGPHPSLLGSAIVSGKVTDLLDIHSVTQTWDADSQTGAGFNGRTSVLVADASPFSRALVRSYLEVVGHRVIEASNCDEALQKLDEAGLLAVMAALDLPEGGAFQLAQAIRRRVSDAQIPVIALSDRRETDSDETAGRFAGCLFKYDRDAMVHSLERLARALEKENVHGTELAGVANQC